MIACPKPHLHAAGKRSGTSEASQPLAHAPPRRGPLASPPCRRARRDQPDARYPCSPYSFPSLRTSRRALRPTSGIPSTTFLSPDTGVSCAPSPVLLGDTGAPAAAPASRNTAHLRARARRPPMIYGVRTYLPVPRAPSEAGLRLAVGDLGPLPLRGTVSRPRASCRGINDSFGRLSGGPALPATRVSSRGRRTPARPAPLPRPTLRGACIAAVP